MQKVLIVWGGWNGHEPENVASFFSDLLSAEGYHVDVRDTLDAFLEPLESYNLIVPVWTMGEITADQCNNVCKAVARHGVGLAGAHGGMCDSFRTNTEWQYMTGGQWVAHPGDDGVKYQVTIDRNNPHPITEGLPDFEVVSEQYYLHTDPANNVLASCEFPNPSVQIPESNVPNVVNTCAMPTVWTKPYGTGRVFYTALGHKRSVLETEVSREICRRGLLWAARHD